VYLNISHATNTYKRTYNNLIFWQNSVTNLGLIVSVFSTHIASFWLGKIFKFCWEVRLCKEDTSDTLVAMKVFVTGVIYCMLEIVRSVSLLPSRNITVWFGQQKKNKDERKATHIFKEWRAQFEVKHSEITWMWNGKISRLCQTVCLQFDIVKCNKIYLLSK
jgi:hypothetical protein